MRETPGRRITALKLGFDKSVLAQACAATVALITLGQLQTAHASDFSLENGVTGQWSLGTSIGSSWRAGNADLALIGPGNGGRGSTGMNDDGELNYGKGSAYSTVAKVSGEVKLKKDNLGAVLGGKAWYDYAGKRKSVAHGSFANGYVPDTSLDDSGYDRLSKFSGAAFENAYAFGTFDVAEGKVLNVKVGNHVVNWGESIFIPGVNQFGAVDITAANRPGTQVKEILLAIPQLSASLDLQGGLNLEMFYQFRWKKNNLDGCGTYWSVSDLLNCPGGAVTGGDPLSDRTQYDGTTLVPGLPPFNFRLGRADDIKAKNSGQFGLAARYRISAIDTEIGGYFANYHARNPTFSLIKTPSPGASIWSGALAPFGGVPPTEFLWDYSAENIKVFGASASTTVVGWTLNGEASYTKNMPVQISTVDMVTGAAAGVGPQASLATRPAGSLLRGYELKSKTQLQVSTVKIFSQVAGAEALTLVGEVAYQHWSGIGDPNTSTRYGRAAVYGLGQTASIPCAATGNPNPDNCENKGYYTSNAWGYRVLAEFSYPNVVAGVNLKPRLSWSHDVKGHSADSLFVEDRQILGVGVRAEYNNQYYADIGYTRFNRGAKYDVFHDRDNFSMVVGVNF